MVVQQVIVWWLLCWDVQPVGMFTADKMKNETEQKPNVQFSFVETVSNAPRWLLIFHLSQRSFCLIYACWATRLMSCFTAEIHTGLLICFSHVFLMKNACNMKSHMQLWPPPWLQCLQIKKPMVGRMGTVCAIWWLEGSVLRPLPSSNHAWGYLTISCRPFN